MSTLAQQSRAVRPGRRRALRCALTLVEVVIAAVLVAVALAASLATVGATGRSARDLAAFAQGQLLADRLMSEILMQAYEDPDGSILFTIELGETSTTRATFDDVDDYDGWAASPPEDKNGVALPDASGWTERVAVRRVAPDNLDNQRALESGIKRIVVTLTNGTIIIERTAIRTSAWKTLEAR